MGVMGIALLWGFAEATLFFIVPDVWLTFVGRDSLARGLKACLFALAGALLGGVLMYGWGNLKSDSAQTTLQRVPGIDAELIADAQADLGESGVTAIMAAPLKGVPYKIYAAESPRNEIPFYLFALITIPARLLRFVATTVCVHYTLKLVLGKATARTRLIALSSGWIIFYAFYFVRMGW